MSKLLILVNHATTLCHFRTELVAALLKDGYEVVISSPYDPRLEPFREMGCELRDIPLSRHGTNPFREARLIASYKRLLKHVRPDAVLSFTVKPNIYGAIACRTYGIPILPNITGLGGALENGGIIRAITIFLYRYAFRKTHAVFFQNTENLRFFQEHRILRGRHVLLPGSGVNLTRFTPLPYPSEDTVRFLFVGRMSAAKGIREYLEAAKSLQSTHPHAEFHMCGSCEDGYRPLLEQAKQAGVIHYHGEVSDVRPLLQTAHCVVLPSYHEGMANALLEAAASARPVIASDIPGCRETFDDGLTGFACQPRSAASLTEAMERFIALPHEAKATMGLAGRRKVESAFDRQLVVEAYRTELNTLHAKTPNQEEETHGGSV